MPIFRIVKEVGSHLNDIHYIIQRRQRFLWFKFWVYEYDDHPEYSALLGYDNLEDAKEKLNELRNRYTIQEIIE